jgi:hypothetical protein
MDAGINRFPHCASFRNLRLFRESIKNIFRHQNAGQS